MTASRDHPAPFVIAHWTGRESRALREAKRMTIVEFASRLGISDRMISKWEFGGATVRPRPMNQAALDTFLLLSDYAEKARFAQLLDEANRQLYESRTGTTAANTAVVVTEE